MNNVVKIPKDLANIKEKFILGLTKRQVLCFGIGAAIGLPAFYISNNILGLGLQISCLALGVFAAPGVLCGLYHKNGFVFEQKIKFMVQFFSKPRVRTYQSENAFSMIERQLEYDRLKKLLINSEKQR